MQYLDDIIARRTEKCTEEIIGDYDLTVDSTELTADSTLVTADSTI